MKTGFKDLDKLITITPGEVIIVGSRPSMGKSTFIRQIALNFAKNGDGYKPTIAYFDLQTTSSQSIFKTISLDAEVDFSKISKEINFKTFDLWKTSNVNILKKLNNSEKLTDDEWLRFDSACENFYNGYGLKATFYGFHEMSLEKYFGFLDKLNSIPECMLPEPLKEIPHLIIIDYIQISFIAEQRNVAITNLLSLIKQKATEFNFVVIVASQLSKKVDERPGRRPMLSDLSDSGSISEVADKVIFVLRRDYYDPLDKPGMAEIIVAKNRNGTTGSINLIFRKEVPKFENYENFINF